MGTWWGNLFGALLLLASLATASATAAALRRARRAMTAGIRPPRSPEQRLDLYELAYLHGQASRVVDVALLRMHRGRRLTVRRTAVDRVELRPSGRGPRDDVETMALDLMAGAADGEGGLRWPPVFGDGHPRMRALRDRLVLDGLMSDDNFPLGVLRRSPATQRWLAARNRHATVVRWLPATAAAGVVLAVAAHALLPLLGYPPLLWWARAVRERAEGAFAPISVTDAGRAAMKAAERPEWIRPGESAGLRDLAVHGLVLLSARHPLRLPEPPRRADPPPRPEPPREPVVIYEGPGLGGL
ncbi:TIGR04222 domain-containing membrane protein [Streptomyces sp. NPDC093071]|uniref:TIGR04222 domain-containing membrane protein n=1 Tax=Streptomyces sp. NPDC093071 TaxID=3366022 RepID=UPI0037F12E71